MGGVQVTVSWSTDVLVTVMFPTGPGEAGEEREGEGCAYQSYIGAINQSHVQLTYNLQSIISHNSSSVTMYYYYVYLSCHPTHLLAEYSK